MKFMWTYYIYTDKCFYLGQTFRAVSSALTWRSINITLSSQFLLITDPSFLKRVDPISSLQKVCYGQFSSAQCLSHVQLLWTPKDYSMPDFPDHHQLPELAQTHVHQVSDAIQPSHPLSSPSPPTFNLPQHQGLFHWVRSSHQVAKELELQLQHQSFQWIFRVDFLWDWLVWSPCSPRDSQESSPTPQFKSINFSALSHFYGPTLTSIHDYLKIHCLDQIDPCQQCLCFLICCLGLSSFASLSKFQEMVMDRKAWHVAVHGVTKITLRHHWATEHHHYIITTMVSRII